MCPKHIKNEKGSLTRVTKALSFTNYVRNENRVDQSEDSRQNENDNSDQDRENLLED